MQKSRTLLLPLLAFVLLRAAPAQEYQGKQLVKASFHADTTAVVPGRTFTVGLLLKMAAGWHTYWAYSGDAGLATRIDWKLPEGFSAGPIQWPIPQKMVEPGDLITFGYGGEVLLLVDIKAPPEIKVPDVTLEGDAAWLVCEELCIPGSAKGLSITLPVADRSEPANLELFRKFRSKLPRDNPPFNLSWDLTPRMATLRVSDVEAEDKLEFFPLPGENIIVGHVKIERGTTNSDRLIRVPIEDAPESGQYILDGVLAKLSPDEKHSRQGWHVSSKKLRRIESAVSSSSGAPNLADDNRGGLLLNLVFGFLGGIILNVMPCVLPVITLKLLGFVRQAGEKPAKIFRIGMSFVAGIFAWFLAIAILASVLHLGGGQLNWAFQFQNPYFVVAMSAIIFVFSLNLLGVFEIVLPGSANSKVVDLASREGYAGAFLHGVFATLLATPCLAPFLGAAVGFAVAQPPPVIFAVFIAIAAGMSLPYVILSLRPQWTQFLPRPGVWMERVKQGMGFLLMATVLWFLWILGKQRGPDGMLWIIAFLLTLAVACWILGTFSGPMASRRSRRLALLAIAVVAGGGLYFFVIVQFRSATNKPNEHAIEPDGIAWEPFSHEALNEAIHNGRTVFLDFTADWCLNCKANERLILESNRVREAFKHYDVLPMKADWTNGDPEITKMLRSYGRAGVPTYAVYRGGSTTPVLLPEVLTRDRVVEAVANDSIATN